MKSITWISRSIGAVVAVLALAAPPGLSSAATGQTIGVPDFALHNVPPNIAQTTLSRFAADTAAAMLQRAVRPPTTVIPRQTVVRAETALGWKIADNHVPARLAALAERIGAAHLVVGTVDRLFLQRFSNSISRGEATVSLQLFTAGRATVTGAVTGTGSANDTNPRNATESALRNAIAQAMKTARERTQIP